MPDLQRRQAEFVGWMELQEKKRQFSGRRLMLLDGFGVL